MRRWFCLSVALVCTLAAGEAQANTLDPSHPFWAKPGASRRDWARALVSAAGERAAPRKWHDGELARGRVVAAGVRVLVVPVLPADAGPAPRTREDLKQRWAADLESSVRGFWRFASAGQLDLDVVVLPWLRVPGTLASTYPNVIDGRPATQLTAGPRNLATDALEAAARVVDDLHAFDDDGPDGMPGSGDDDGVLDFVVVLHPFEGWEVETPDVERGIISLQARLFGEEIGGTGLRADAFLVASATGPLGVWVHEFGHLLGLPDLYDLDRTLAAGTPGGPGPQGGLGRWSLMASGTWAGGGATPSGLDAWSSVTLGFAELRVADAPVDLSLPWVDGSAASVLRVEPLGDWGGEVFLVQARRSRPGAIVDGALPGGGALVYRVRPDLAVNRIDAGFVELLQADGLGDLDAGVNDGDATDPWDGTPGRARLDGGTTPSSQSANPSATRTPPVLEFAQQTGGMEVGVALADGPALRLAALGLEDPFIGDRAWLRPGETAALQLRMEELSGSIVSGATVSLSALAGGRSVTFDPAGAVPLVAEGPWYVPESPIEIADTGSTTEGGVASLELRVAMPGAAERVVVVGLPVTFDPGLGGDALARFSQEIGSAPADTTRFARLGLDRLPRPALVGYELVTDGVPGYANSVEVSLVSPWFATDPGGAMAWLWARGETESGLPGQVFDGAAVELFVPDRGWAPLEPSGVGTVWIARRSTAATRDRLGLGGDRPEWTPYSCDLGAPRLPVRLRVRFAADATVAGSGWEVAGLQTDAAPRAEITLEERRGSTVVASASFHGDLSRVDLASYQYRVAPGDPWAPASGPFLILGDRVLGIVLDLLPESVQRAEIALFAGGGSTTVLLGKAGFRRDGAPALPALLANPAQGTLVLQPEDRSDAREYLVYDLRGRQRARVMIPPHTTWFEWVPRADGGAALPSGQYFLRGSGKDAPALRFIWFR